MLYVYKIHGFIRYLCTFPCFDDTAKKAPKTKNGDRPKPFTKNICQAPHTKENLQNVLVMPYIQGGSIENYVFTQDNIQLLQSLLAHTIMSLTVAYDRIQFIHGDLHLGNILFKKTTKTEITYSIRGSEPIVLPTVGYKVVIMDFEKSRTSEYNPREIAWFWKTYIF